jgi:hydroxymethylbilane synthase
MKKRVIKIATRPSELALWQANFVGSLLEELGFGYELLPILSSADQHQLPLNKSGGKGQFVKSIQQAVLDFRADIAVHSAKDLACVTSQGLYLAAVPKRYCVNDVLVANKTFATLPQNTKIATGSIRRASQLKLIRDDLECVQIRGNVPTRINRFKKGEYAAIMLAQAGLERLGLMQDNFEIIPVDVMIPAAGQGALAVECRENDKVMQKILTTVNDYNSQQALLAERACLCKLGGHCFAPIGCYAKVIGNDIELVANVVDKKELRVVKKGKVEDAVIVGIEAAIALNNLGAQEILQGCYEKNN